MDVIITLLHVGLLIPTITLKMWACWLQPTIQKDFLKIIVKICNPILVDCGWSVFHNIIKDLEMFTLVIGHRISVHHKKVNMGWKECKVCQKSNHTCIHSHFHNIYMKKPIQNFFNFHYEWMVHSIEFMVSYT
jgi:hypothetical protein